MYQVFVGEHQEMPYTMPAVVMGIIGEKCCLLLWRYEGKRDVDASVGARGMRKNVTLCTDQFVQLLSLELV